MSKARHGGSARQRGGESSPPQTSPAEEHVSEAALVEIQTLLQRIHQGPMPSVEYLEWFEKRVPDAPERFLKTYENQSAHRIELERFNNRWDVWLALNGQICTVILFLAVLVVAVLIANSNHASTASVVAGSVLGGLDLVGIAGLLIRREMHKGPKG